MPDRFAWALQRLRLRTTSRVLEIGCGTGVMLAQVADRARLAVGIDRSATAIAKARTRNRAAISDGRVVVRTGSLASVSLPEAPFDLAFAINVNLVWTTDATAELARLSELVHGPVLWFFDRDDDDRIAKPALAHLTAARYRATVECERGMLLVTSRARRSRRS